MFLVNVYRREGLQQVLGNCDGQGFYHYKTFKNFKKFILDNPTHMVFHSYRNPKYFLKVYECTENTKYNDESDLRLVLNNGPQN